MFATPGPIGYYVGQEGDGPPTLGLHTFPLPLAVTPASSATGRAWSVPAIAASPGSASIRASSTAAGCTGGWRRKMRRQSERGACLLRDEPGYVTETAAANFLLVRTGPSLRRRRFRPGGISLQRGRGTCAASSAFPSTSGRCTWTTAGPPTRPCCAVPRSAWPASSRIDDTPFPGPGPIFGGCWPRGAARVGVDIRGQIFAGRVDFPASAPIFTIPTLDPRPPGQRAETQPGYHHWTS